MIARSSAPRRSPRRSNRSCSSAKPGRIRAPAAFMTWFEYPSSSDISAWVRLNVSRWVGVMIRSSQWPSPPDTASRTRPISPLDSAASCSTVSATRPAK
jgi:hypothetical protein